MARASTRMATTSDRVDWTIMVSLAHRRTGRVSVGLKAVALEGGGHSWMSRPGPGSAAPQHHNRPV